VSACYCTVTKQAQLAMCACAESVVAHAHAITEGSKYVETTKPMGSTMSLVRATHLASFSAWYGTQIWVTFFAGK
jgi:hypothetical protein